MRTTFEPFIYFFWSRVRRGSDEVIIRNTFDWNVLPSPFFPAVRATVKLIFFGPLSSSGHFAADFVFFSEVIGFKSLTLGCIGLRSARFQRPAKSRISVKSAFCKNLTVNRNHHAKFHRNRTSHFRMYSEPKEKHTHTYKLFHIREKIVRNFISH